MSAFATSTLNSLRKNLYSVTERRNYTKKPISSTDRLILSHGKIVALDYVIKHGRNE